MKSESRPDPHASPSTDARHPAMQAGWIDQPHQRLHLPALRLESGESIEDFELSYVVHGALAPAHRPVVLALSAVASSHHRLDFLIGPGKALDPARVTIIAVDAIGNGLTTSPSTATRQAGMAFPRFTIRDMVNSQAALLDALGIEQVDAVIGASMGGMQALQWGVSYPDRVQRIVALTPMAKTTPWSAAVNETSRRALLADPCALAGSLAAWSAWVPLMQLLAGRTPSSVDAQFSDPAQVRDWIAQRVTAWEQQDFRAIDWLYQSWAYDAHDVGTTPGYGGNTAAALAAIRADTLIMAPPLDLYNSAQAARDCALAIHRARFVEIDSDWGHQSASAADSGAAAQLNAQIGSFLATG